MIDWERLFFEFTWAANNCGEFEARELFLRVAGVAKQLKDGQECVPTQDGAHSKNEYPDLYRRGFRYQKERLEHRAEILECMIARGQSAIDGLGDANAAKSDADLRKIAREISVANGKAKAFLNELYQQISSTPNWSKLRTDDQGMVPEASRQRSFTM